MANGKLFYYHGTMSSGKSLQLLATAHNFENRKIPYIILKSSVDTRDGESNVFSRALGKKECVTISPDTDIFCFITTFMNICTIMDNRIRWILVDESQFLTPQQVDELAALVDICGINVICYGLRTDFKTNLFPGSKRLFEVADTIEEIKSQCSCDGKTIFNARVTPDGKFITNGEQIEIGGDDRYISVCRKCYYEKIGHPRYKNREDE